MEKPVTVIIKLVASNFKRLRGVEITPDGALVQITGDNDQGKSSVLDAISALIEGAEHIQAEPIRKGWDKARIYAELGEGDKVSLIVQRKFTANNRVGTLSVETPDGARLPSPTAVLNAFMGVLGFDPLEFSRMKPEEQYDALRRAVPLEEDIDHLDQLNAGDFGRRTDINREAKTLRAQAEGIRVEEGLPEELLDTSALVDELQMANETNANVERERQRRVVRRRDVDRKLEQAEHDRGRIRRLEQEIEALRASVQEAVDGSDEILRELAELPELPPPLDLQAIRAKLPAAEETNRKIAQRERRKQLEAEAEAKEAAALDLTQAMEARTKVKEEAIAKAKMPVEGLGFGRDSKGNGVVLMDGVPFDQSSTSKQIRVGVAIAMAANPKLRVILIREGSLISEPNLAILAEIAREHGFQIWVERVDTSGTVGFVIEDGAVKGKPLPPEEAPTPQRKPPAGKPKPTTLIAPGADDGSLI